MARKTFRVSEFRDMVNKCLMTSKCNKNVREGMIGILESVLLDTGNYHSWGHLDANDVPEGCLPGVDREYANCDQCGQTPFEVRKIPTSGSSNQNDILCQACFCKARDQYPVETFHSCELVSEGFTFPDDTRRVYF